MLTGCRTSPPACCAQRGEAAPAVSSVQSLVDSAQTWQSDDGSTCRLSDLAGRPVVISMFFCSCQGICLITKDDMKAIEASLPSAVREHTTFVLVTLDPEHDTLGVLREYREEYGLSTRRWKLLRGSAAATSALAAQLGIGYGRDDSGRFKHASRISVLDSTGHIVFAQDGTHADLDQTVHFLTRR